MRADSDIGEGKSSDMECSTRVLLALGEKLIELLGELASPRDESIDRRFRLASAAWKYSDPPGETGSSVPMSGLADCSSSPGATSAIGATP